MEYLLEKWKVTQYKSGCVHNTVKISSRWFSFKNLPDTNQVDDNDFFWISTMKCRRIIGDKQCATNFGTAARVIRKIT